MSHNVQYDEKQVGAGQGVKNVFAGSSYQRGSGIGNFIEFIFVVFYIHTLLREPKPLAAERIGLNDLEDVANHNI